MLIWLHNIRPNELKQFWPLLYLVADIFSMLFILVNLLLFLKVLLLRESLHILWDFTAVLGDLLFIGYPLNVLFNDLVVEELLHLQVFLLADQLDLVPQIILQQ